MRLRRLLCRGQLHAVRLRATEHALLLGDWEPVEARRGRGTHRIVSTWLPPSPARPGGISATSRAAADLGVRRAIDETGDVASAEVGERLLSAATLRGVGTTSVATRALCQVTSGSAPLIHTHASCWVAGVLSVAPLIDSNAPRSAEPSDGATSRTRRLPNAITMFTPPADTSGVRSCRNAATASCGRHSVLEVIVPFRPRRACVGQDACVGSAPRSAVSTLASLAAIASGMGCRRLWRERRADDRCDREGDRRRRAGTRASRGCRTAHAACERPPAGHAARADPGCGGHAGGRHGLRGRRPHSGQHLVGRGQRLSRPPAGGRARWRAFRSRSMTGRRRRAGERPCCSAAARQKAPTQS